jgi:iron complex transport system permease protein
VLTSSDLLLRTGWAGNDIPVGIFTAALGAPFFLWLLYRSRRQLLL